MPDARRMEGLYRLAKRLFAQSAAMGVLPTLYAATSPNVVGGDFIGPASLGGARGYPGKSRSSARSHDVASAQELWRVSEEMTGIAYRELTGR